MSKCLKPEASHAETSSVPNMNVSRAENTAREQCTRFFLHSRNLVRWISGGYGCHEPILFLQCITFQSINQNQNIYTTNVLFLLSSKFQSPISTLHDPTTLSSILSFISIFMSLSQSQFTARHNKRENNYLFFIIVFPHKQIIYPHKYYYIQLFFCTHLIFSPYPICSFINSHPTNNCILMQ